MEAESIDTVFPFEDDYIAADQARANRRIERRGKAIAESAPFDLVPSAAADLRKRSELSQNPRFERV